ncbi:hypothetical protein KGY14_09005 [Ameyamaea chiangmaiensis]|uniref:Rhamnogalacturonase A/B/Epimerase-like pectate lyase domain-containing protein n=1 Tax=Ameyamaea chiangmaiensis TaxID=442969 RepID=A0A850PAI9_9PROT|nr:glycosyl hydrolase family 28-related protein [Ameyamaea chiangmaiensis]MBS4075331.1 hypothetical protein [Ameyamaea chiangmaiensis]NVN41537.1 hypothetical protein [Ameyamaea chiangmaiensis]
MKILSLLGILSIMLISLAEAKPVVDTSVPSQTYTSPRHSETDISDKFVKAQRGTTARREAERIADQTNVLDFGVVASAEKHDNTAGFQASIDAACAKVASSSNNHSYPSGASSGGGDIFVPQGKYAVSGPILWTCPVHLHGAGRGTTTIIWNGTGAETLFKLSAPLTDGHRFWRHGALSDLDIVNDGSQTGSAIRVESCTQCEVYNIGTYGMYRSIVFVGGQHNNLHDFDFMQGHVQEKNGKQKGSESFSTSIEFYGSDHHGGSGCTASDNGNCSGRADILSIYNGSVDAALDGMHEPTDCIYVHDFAATMWVKNLNCNQVRNGINVRCDDSVSINNCPQFLSLDRIEVETNNTTKTNINHSIIADNFAHIVCMDCEFYASQPGINNVALYSSRFHSGNFQSFGGKIQSSLGPCVLIQIDGAQFHGGVITSCGSSGGSDNQWGIQFRGATNGSVDHVQFCHDNVGGTDSKMRPVLIDKTTTYTIVDGNSLQSCAGPSENRNPHGHNLITNEVGGG